VKTHNTVYDGDEESAGGGSGWHNASKQYTTNPNTTDSWTWDEIDAMEIGGSLKTSCAANNAFFTQIYVIIDYSVETPKTSSDTGQGSEAGASLNSAYSRAETGTGSESLGSRLLGVAEEGGGTEALLTRLLASAESGSGLDGGGLFFASSDVGSGLDAILALETMLTGADSGSGIDTSCLIKALLSTDIGLGTDAVVAFLARFISSELVVGSDHLVVKVESAPKSGGMKLPPGGKTSIPSRRVNL